MLEFAKNLQRLISINKLEQAIDELQNALDAFNPGSESGKTEQKDLRTQIIAASQRLYLVKEKEMKGNLSDDEIMRERRSVSNQFLDILNDLDKYTAVHDYLREMDEEQAWRKTNTLNAIEAYKEYLTKYPRGKYADDANKYIEMLRMMEEQKAKEKAKEMQNSVSEKMHTQPEPTAQTHTAYSKADEGIAHDGENISGGMYVVLIIGSIFIPLIGLGAGAYFYYTKSSSTYKYSADARKKGRVLMIIGAVMAFIYLIYYA